MYSATSDFVKEVSNKVGFNFEAHPIEAMKKIGKTYVRGTALKPDEARILEGQCKKHGYIYRGPFAR